MSALGSVEATLSASQISPWSEASLPAVNVKTTADLVRDDMSPMGGEQYRELTVELELRCRVSGDLVASMADLVTDVFEAVGGSSSIKAAVSDMVMSSVDYSIDEEGSLPVGLARMEWVVTYNVDRADPETLL